MSSLVGYKQVTDTDLYDVSTVAPNGFTLGEVAQGTSGDEYRLVKVGDTSLVKGTVLQSPAFGTAFNSLTPVEAEAGETLVRVTNGSTSFAEDFFAGGTLTVTTGVGAGETYRVETHSAGANAGEVTVQLDRPLRHAFTSTTRVSFRKNDCDGVVIAPAALTGVVVGVAITDAAPGSYTWVQVSGVASVLSDATSIIMGSAVATPSTVIGAATLATAGKVIIGTALQAASSTNFIPVKLNI